MNQSQIKIGTSAWGSKISIKDAINLGLNLTNFGINHFDAARQSGQKGLLNHSVKLFQTKN